MLVLLSMHLIYSLLLLSHTISLSYLTLIYIVLPCLALPCLALPCLALPCLALPCLALHPLPLSSLYLAISFSYSCTIRNELQGELLEPEEAFDMLIASHQSNFRPMYGDSDVLTLSSFDGFEITKQVNITVNYIKFNLIESN